METKSFKFTVGQMVCTGKHKGATRGQITARFRYTKAARSLGMACDEPAYAVRIFPGDSRVVTESWLELV